MEVEGREIRVPNGGEGLKGLEVSIYEMPPKQPVISKGDGWC